MGLRCFAIRSPIASSRGDFAAVHSFEKRRVDRRPTLNRALHLFRISRYADAELELRRTLAEQPYDPAGPRVLRPLPRQAGKTPEAKAEVEQAITLAADWDHAHYCRSVVLQERRRYADARRPPRGTAAQPRRSNNYARLAITLYCQGKWQDSLDAALAGLQYDAEHADCMSLRTMALAKLGRQREALATVDESLARDPDDSYANANKAWALLHEGQPRPRAIDQFRKALRLDPTNEYARHGMVEALKARNPIYRWILAYFLWMGRLDNAPLGRGPRRLLRAGSSTRSRKTLPSWRPG